MNIPYLQGAYNSIDIIIHYGWVNNFLIKDRKIIYFITNVNFRRVAVLNCATHKKHAQKLIFVILNATEPVFACEEINTIDMVYWMQSIAAFRRQLCLSLTKFSM